MMNSLMFSYPSVCHALVSYDCRSCSGSSGWNDDLTAERLVWSSLDRDSTRAVHRLVSGIVHPPPQDARRQVKPWQPMHLANCAPDGHRDSAGAPALTSGSKVAERSGFPEGGVVQEEVDTTEEIVALDLLLCALTSEGAANGKEGGFVAGGGIQEGLAGDRGWSSLSVPRLWLPCQPGAIGLGGISPRGEYIIKSEIDSNREGASGRRTGTTVLSPALEGPGNGGSSSGAGDQRKEICASGEDMLWGLSLGDKKDVIGDVFFESSPPVTASLSEARVGEAVTTATSMVDGCRGDNADGRTSAAVKGTGAIAGSIAAACTASAAAAASSTPESGWCNRHEPHVRAFEPFRLVVYSAHGLTVSLLVGEADGKWRDGAWYASLGTDLAAELSVLSGTLGAVVRKPDMGDTTRYLYFNDCNLAMMASPGAFGGRQTSGSIVGRLGWRLDGGATPRRSVPVGLARQIMRAQHDLRASAAGGVRHISTRDPDGWLMARSSGSRQLYTLVESKHASFAEAQQEILALIATRFSHIFLDPIA
mmetsp:Transcript_21042/g.64287  ORF Transcript_21042/g.64287 Transcript_21042/m.64287 type:complete len:535 (-) Transcript_21042:70-1674(-)